MKPESISADSSPDIILDWLHKDGWSIKHEFAAGNWCVRFTKDSQELTTKGTTLEQAWLLAVEAVETQGQLAV